MLHGTKLPSSTAVKQSKKDISKGMIRKMAWRNSYRGGDADMLSKHQHAGTKTRLTTTTVASPNISVPDCSMPKDKKPQASTMSSQYSVDIPFTASHDQQSFKLIELPPELLALLESDNTPT